MTRRSASRGILYSAPPTGSNNAKETETESDEPSVEATETTDTAAADD